MMHNHHHPTPPLASSGLSASPGLVRAELLDCHGHTTHRLTVLPDGLVEVVAGGGLTVVVDPHRRVVLRPRGARLPEQVLSHATALAADLRP